MATETSKVRAVTVDESDMYCVLNATFGPGTFEVALDRDVYRITAPRKLTLEERSKFCAR